MLKLFARFADKTDSIVNPWMAMKVELTTYDSELDLVIRQIVSLIDRKTRYKLFDYLAKSI